MAHPILMPKAGQSMTEGKIVAWLKKEGDAVARGEPLLEIETDKANLEVEAEEAGVLRKILHREGETRPVLTVIGVIGAAGEEIDFEKIAREPAAAPSPTAPPPAPSRSPAPSPAPAPGRARAAAPEAAPHAATLTSPGALSARPPSSPLARRIARELGVDLSRLRGTGPGGRILRRDVEGARQAPARSNGASILPLHPERKPYPEPSPRPEAVVPFTGMRKAIASALEQSKREIPHFYASVTIDAGEMLALKAARGEGGVRVTLNDIIVRAVALALADEPRVNCRVFPDRIEYPASANIGIAVGTDGGLVVPVILEAEKRDLDAVAAESARIVESALKGKLIGSGQGTFTVSNLGMHGVESFSAIINPPEGAILAVGAVVQRVVPLGGGLVPRPTFTATLSADHRAIDGLLAARFLARLKHLLETAERF